MAKSTSVKLAYLSASLSFISVTLGILAFGTPYWIRYDGVIVVSISGTRSHVQMRFHYGFWRYCNDVSTSIQSLNNCGAVKTHTDLEQLTICLVMLSIVLSVNAFINNALYLCLMKNEKMCLYVTMVSSIVSGLTMAAAVINYGIQSHATEITHSFTLPFSVANLSTSFWLSITDSIIISSTAVITIISLYYHTDKSTNYDVSLTSIEDANHTLDRKLQTGARYVETSDAVYNHIVYKPDTHHVANEGPSDNCSMLDGNNEPQFAVDLEDRHPWNLDEDDNRQRETNNAKRKQNCKTKQGGMEALIAVAGCQNSCISNAGNTNTSNIAKTIDTDNKMYCRRQAVSVTNDPTNSVLRLGDSPLDTTDDHLQCALMETNQSSIPRLNHTSSHCLSMPRIEKGLCSSRSYNMHDTTKPTSTTSVSRSSPRRSSFAERLRARRMARLQTIRNVHSHVDNIELTAKDESTLIEKYSCKLSSELEEQTQCKCVYFRRNEIGVVSKGGRSPHLDGCKFTSYTTDSMNTTSIQPTTCQTVDNQRDSGSVTNRQWTKVSVDSIANVSVSREKGIEDADVMEDSTMLNITTTHSRNTDTCSSNSLIRNSIRQGRSSENCNFGCVRDTVTLNDTFFTVMSNQFFISSQMVDQNKRQSENKHMDNKGLIDNTSCVQIKQNIVPQIQIAEKQELFRNLGKVHTESSAARIDIMAATFGRLPLRTKPNICRQSPSPMRAQPKDSSMLTAKEINRVKNDV